MDSFHKGAPTPAHSSRRTANFEPLFVEPVEYKIDEKCCGIEMTEMGMLGSSKPTGLL
jgi:hypothetical protein